MRWVLSLLFLLATPVPAAETVVAGLSQSRISITADFSGSEIWVFGAVKREEPAPEGNLHVIVTIEGPSLPVTVRRKAKRYGIWINTDSVEVEAAPSFYAVATTAAWPQVIDEAEDARHQISIPRMIRSLDTGAETPAFTDALIRLRGESRLYAALPGSITLDQDTLFHTEVVLPANLVEGTYRTRIFLTRDGRVIDQYETAIDVQKAGLERWLYRLSQEQPFLYGLLALALAAGAGWAASEAFRFIRS